MNNSNECDRLFRRGGTARKLLSTSLCLAKSRRPIADSPGAMDMLTILLIRTGATEYACQARIQGTLDIPLSEDGREHVEKVIQQLRGQQVDAIYAGPCRATQQTAEHLSEPLQLKPKTIDKLSNLNLGLWQGMLLDDVKVKQPKVYRQWQEHPETVCPPDGETLQAVRERLEQALAKIVKKHKLGVVAMVLPEPVRSVMRTVLRETDTLGNLWDLECENQPAWELIEVIPRVASL